MTLSERVDILLGDKKELAKLIALVAVPILIFLWFFHPAVLDPTNVSWLFQKDWGQHVLGWHAFRYGADGFNHQNLLAHPTGLSVIYTDSNPLFALPLKLISPLLPANFQYIGPWFLFCICAHFYLAYKLLERHAPSFWSALVGAILLTLVPPLFNRIMHDTLVAQFLILWAFYIYFEITEPRRKAIHWAIMLGVTGFIHPYILIMVLALWGGEQLRRVWPQLMAREWIQVARTVGVAILTLLAPIITLGLSGAYAAGQSAGSFGYGFYSMGLDALFNPSRKDFTFGGLVSVPQDAGQSMEGFMYMGAGLLFLMVAAVVLYFRSEGARTIRDTLSKSVWLIGPFVVLFIIALSSKVQFYDIEIFKYPTPKALDGVLGIMRASGRMFWPMAYFMVLLAILTVYRTKLKTMAIILPLALVIQVIDITPFARSVHSETAMAANRTVYQKVPSKLWDELITNSDLVSFQPANAHINKRLFYELTWRSVSHAVPVNTMYAARPHPRQTQLERIAHSEFVQGKLDPNTLYVFFNKCQAPAGAQHRLRELDGVFILPPVKMLDKLPQVAQAPGVEFGEDYNFTWNALGSCFLEDNWLSPDSKGVWSRAGQPAELSLPLADRPRHDISLSLSLLSFLSGNKTKVYVNDRLLTHLDLTTQITDHEIVIPRRWIKDNKLNIRLETDAAASLRAPPTASENARRLGIRLYDLRLNEAKAS